MLANGATLGYKEKAADAAYKDLPGLREIPEMGVSTEKVENTVLTAANKTYENGIGDPGDLVYKFLYDNAKADSPYRVLRKMQEDGKTLNWQEKLSDGTTTEWEGQVSVKRTGGSVNGLLEFNATITIASGMTVTDPA